MIVQIDLLSAFQNFLPTFFCSMILLFHYIARKSNLKTFRIGFNPYRAGTELIRLNIVNIMDSDALALSGHQHPWHWLCKMNKFLSYLR